MTSVTVLFRSLEATSSCPSGRSTVVTLRCDPEKSTTGDLSVPRCRSSDPTITFALYLSVQSFSPQRESGPIRMWRILSVLLAKEKMQLTQQLLFFFLLYSFNYHMATLGRAACSVYTRGSERVVSKPDYAIDKLANVLTAVVILLPQPTCKLVPGFCSHCPAGTCDGCTFYFFWESSGACPTCTERDYHQIEGACKGGQQVCNCKNIPELRHTEFQMKQSDVYAFTSSSADIKSQLAPLLTA